MVLIVLCVLIILYIEFKTIYKQFQTPDDVQDEEKEELLSYIDQMRSYLGFKTFKYIVILSSFIINSVYITYYLTSAYFIHFLFFQIISCFLLIYRIFKIVDSLDLDYGQIDYIVGLDVMIGLQTIIVILHVALTIGLLIRIF